MTAALDLFQFTASTKAPARPAEEDAFMAYQAVSNLLLSMHWTSLEIARCRRKADRIAKKLDDPKAQGTGAQRAEAEQKHWSLMQTAKRELDGFKRSARAVARKWEELGPWEQEIREAIFPGWADSPLWDLVRTDQVLGRDKVWGELIRCADAVPAEEGEPCPF